MVSWESQKHPLTPLPDPLLLPYLALLPVLLPSLSDKALYSPEGCLQVSSRGVLSPAPHTSSCPMRLGESEFPERRLERGHRLGQLRVGRGIWEGRLPRRACRVFPLVKLPQVAQDDQDGCLQEYVA